ncbi:hypothetical protein BpHYR1_015730 [Brachionus plicatilis]|uniref:Uncharacterized protein n=1 Tax=Brachionus plicatilis TaxID=10195 RepID=A0A3M7RKW9_BRAPC|nr:hypothetical protein BpHYR1_015730 [Brachionus plicatilis]
MNLSNIIIRQKTLNFYIIYYILFFYFFFYIAFKAFIGINFFIFADLCHEFNLKVRLSLFKNPKKSPSPGMGKLKRDILKKKVIETSLFTVESRHVNPLGKRHLSDKFEFKQR